jgi:NDP-sugar pyrophosphorylase family protein
MQKITKAMILAAGFGTRLKPLTDAEPKPLVKVNGTPMIEFVIERLVEFGIKEIVINTHYLAEQIEFYFRENDFGVKITLSHEKEILGTGGGIKNAEKFLKSEDAFIVHNVDVLSDIDFGKMADFHFRKSAFATLAVKKRNTTRPLLIDNFNHITGRKSTEKIFRYRNAEGIENVVGFCGIHIISSQIFDYFDEYGFFDIFTTYFRLISEHKNILGFDPGDCMWKDLGKPDNKLILG